MGTTGDGKSGKTVAQDGKDKASQEKVKATGGKKK